MILKKSLVLFLKTTTTTTTTNNQHILYKLFCIEVTMNDTLIIPSNPTRDPFRTQSNIKMDLFGKVVNGKKLHPRCLTQFWIRLI